ncbi:MAG: hypothetical protein KatS3mg026_0841 [Bacteroidia bacterium]|nr:MAG: hypothetical protein KatS3mg026_0841 [Bacteroidia bacterium]
MGELFPFGPLAAQPRQESRFRKVIAGFQALETHRQRRIDHHQGGKAFLHAGLQGDSRLLKDNLTAFLLLRLDPLHEVRVSMRMHQVIQGFSQGGFSKNAGTEILPIKAAFWRKSLWASQGFNSRAQASLHEQLSSFIRLVHGVPLLLQETQNEAFAHPHTPCQPHQLHQYMRVNSRLRGTSST